MAHTFEELAYGYIEKQRPNAKRRGLRKAIYTQYMLEHTEGTTESEWRKDEFYETIRADAKEHPPNFLPDLYEFYPAEDQREIVLWEVEDTCKITPYKMASIWRWFAEMDCWDGWDLKVIITNRYGQGWTTIIDTRAEKAENRLTMRARQDYMTTIPMESREKMYSDATIAAIRQWKCDASS